MIKNIIKKIFYSGITPEKQDLLLKLFYRYHIIQFLSFLSLWTIIFIFPLVPLLIIYICEGKKMATSMQIALLVFLFVYFLIFITVFKTIGKKILLFSHQVAKKVYFRFCTAKGKAVSKEEYKSIKINNSLLYDFISNQKCQGYCYSICFEILKILKKGSIEFVAIKRAFDVNDRDFDGKHFTIHVLYINNGWAFDTYSARQYPIDKIHDIFNAKIYKTFNFSEIKDKNYKDFRSEVEPDLIEWCKTNGCSHFLKEVVT